MGDKNSEDMIKMAAGIIIALLVISVAFLVYRTAKSSTQSALTKIEDMTTTLNESDFTDVEGEVVVGNRVQSYVTQWAGQEVVVEVITKSGNDTCYNYTDDSLSTVSDAKASECKVKSSAQYINPSGKFLCELTRDDNNTIKRVTFTQQ